MSKPMDNNCDSNTRAGIGISVGIEDVERLENRLMESGVGELYSPPGKIVNKVLDRVMWHKRISTGDTEY